VLCSGTLKNSSCTSKAWLPKPIVIKDIEALRFRTSFATFAALSAFPTFAAALRRLRKES
jgi:hypothetical protein